MIKVGIIGAGVMGLTLAHKLSQKGMKVSLFESAPQIGGLTTWFDYGAFVWDKYYHVILRSDKHLLGLIDELGLSDSLHWKATKTGFLWNGKHISMSNHWEFLSFPALNLYQKFRLGTGILYSRMIKDPSDLEKISAKEWLISVFGYSVYEKIWEPLIASKYGSLKEEIPATLLWSVINRYASTRSKGDGKEWMGHLKGGGMRSLLQALQEKIESKGGEIFCDAAVKEITEGKIKTSKGEFKFDRIINTLPTFLFNKLAPDLEKEGKLPLFLGVIRLALVLKEPLSPYYVTNLIDKGLPFTGIIEVTALTEPEELSGKALVMLPRYDVPSSPWFLKNDQEIESLFFQSLKKIWPNIQQNVIRSFVHKEKCVQAIWMKSPPLTIEPKRYRDGKIWSVNAELAGRDTLNNNALIDVASRASQLFLESL